jgi:hypothetical protein
MNTLKLKRCFFIAAAIALLAVFVAAPSGAGDLNWKLRGDYAFNSGGACVFASIGFELNSSTGKWGRKPLGAPYPGTSYNYAIQGVFSFDGHGGFTFNGEALHLFLDPFLFPPPPSPPAPPYSLWPPYETFKYPVNNVNAVGTGEYAVINEANGLFVEITFTTLNFTNPDMSPPLDLTAKGFTFRGRLDTFAGAGIVFLSSTNETPQDVLGGSYQGAQRICNGSGNMVKLSPRNNWLLSK